MKKYLSFVLILSFTSSVFGELPEWSYDPGPNPNTQMGRELIDITANIPNMPEISNRIMGRKQKFRPAFGPIPWRMLQGENKVKILFIGQDGTHIAEAAGRPATAGFGGRAQDLANYFGVNEGAAFINAYSFTIKGQYGVYGTPYISFEDQEAKVKTANLVSNQLWAMSNHLDSPIVEWRNSLIDWIMRNNKKSLKLVVLFGGAARDTIASYAKSMGAKVYGRHEDLMDKIQVPVTKEEYAGGNNTYPSLKNKLGRDLYEEILGRELDYTKKSDQDAAFNSLKNNIEQYLEKAVFTKGGPYKNGLLNSAQLGGYDLDTMLVNGVKTRSLKGLKLSDGSTIENDVIVISLPHPSSLSRTVMEAESYYDGKEAASKRVMRDVRKLDPFVETGWEITPDPGKVNYFALGENYNYGRTDIGPEYYDFGTPANRMVSKSTARRMSKHANVVIIGTRDNGWFDKKKIKSMTDAKAAFGINDKSLFIARPSAQTDRYTFDPGPGEELAKLMVTSLNFEEIYKTKPGMNFEADGIAAFNIKSHPSVSDFGHYRGTFKDPKVIILADPHGYDDIVTARALTGSRGQYIHGLMEDLNIGDQYLVIKTVPFAMDGANEEEWKATLAATKNYRDALFKKVLSTTKAKVIISDGQYAAKELDRLLVDTKYPKLRRVVNIERSEDASFGIKDAGRKLKQTRQFYKKMRMGRRNRLKRNYRLNITGRMANIPRTHLSFYSRIWEGTSGDRVITSAGKQYEGIAFAEVVPSWAYEQRLQLKGDAIKGVLKLYDVLRDNKLPMPTERIPEYLERMEIDAETAFMYYLNNWVQLSA